MNYSISLQACDRHVVGILVHQNKIKDSWELLHLLVQAIPNVSTDFPKGESFGICTQSEDLENDGLISYLAGVPVDDLRQVQLPFTGYTIPAGKYAVFECADIESIGTTYKQIHDWMPNSGFRRRLNFDFERYDYENGVETIEIWVPV